MSARATDQSRAGFTIVELMIVILIITVLIAILIPAVAGVRVAARASMTKTTMNQVVQAAGQFQADERRLPGYFSANDMGSNPNLSQGFSVMQNVLLDLAGGVVDSNGGNPNPSSNGGTGRYLQVGPRTANNTKVWVDLDAIGVPGMGGKSYYVPDAKAFVAQSDFGQQISTSIPAQPPFPPLPSNTLLPSLIDAFGNPFLAWEVNESALGQVTLPAQFAMQDSSTTPARFYLNSNAAFLKATNLGKSGKDQTNGTYGSMLSAGSQVNNVQSMVGALGSPSYPYRDPNNPTNTPVVASSPAAPFMIHSAGADGVYFGMKDRGARQFGNGFIDYKFNFVTDGGATISATNQYTDSNGQPTNNDVLSQFDDLIGTGGS